jgi:ankyrin repeat protein
LTAAGAQGKTPLHEATCSDHTAVVERLVEKKADIEAKDKVRAQQTLCRSSPHPLPVHCACTLNAPSMHPIHAPKRQIGLPLPLL